MRKIATIGIDDKPMFDFPVRKTLSIEDGSTSDGISFNKRLENAQTLNILGRTFTAFEPAICIKERGKYFLLNAEIDSDYTITTLEGAGLKLLEQQNSKPKSSKFLSSTQLKERSKLRGDIEKLILNTFRDEIFIGWDFSAQIEAASIGLMYVPGEVKTAFPMANAFLQTVAKNFESIYGINFPYKYAFPRDKNKRPIWRRSESCDNSRITERCTDYDRLLIQLEPRVTERGNVVFPRFGKLAY